MDFPVIFGAVLSFSLYYLLSAGRNKKSEKRIHKTKNFLGSLIPSLQIQIKGYQVHIHHWLYLLIILLIVLVFFRESFLNYPFIEGFLIGGIIEGLLYKDRFKLFKKI